MAVVIMICLVCQKRKELTSFLFAESALALDVRIVNACDAMTRVRCLTNVKPDAHGFD